MSEKTAKQKRDSDTKNGQVRMPEAADSSAAFLDGLLTHISTTNRPGKLKLKLKLTCSNLDLSIEEG